IVPRLRRFLAADSCLRAFISLGRGLKSRGRGRSPSALRGRLTESERRTLAASTPWSRSQRILKRITGPSWRYLLLTFEGAHRYQWTGTDSRTTLVPSPS